MPLPPDYPTGPIPRLPSPEEETAQPIRFGLAQLKYVAVALFIPTALTVVGLLIAQAYGLRVNAGISLLLWVLLTFCSCCYMWGVWRARAERRTIAIPPDREIRVYNNWVPLAAFQRMLPLFTGTERDVYLVTRMHWIRWARSAVPLGIATVMLLGLGSAALANDWGASFTIRRHEEHLTKLPLTIFLICLLVSLVLAGRILQVVVQWYSEYFVMTEHQLLHIKLPPLVLLWMDEDSEEIPSHGFVHFLRVDQKFFGRVLGFGSFTADTPSQLDDKFHNIEPLPRIKEVRIIFNQVRERLAHDKSKSYGP